jgi:hypothetical protein
MVCEGHLKEAQASAQLMADLANKLKVQINAQFATWVERYAARQLVMLIISNEFDRNDFGMQAEEAFLKLM